MTPSINLLAETAQKLGERIMQSEWDIVKEELAQNPPGTFAEFRERLQDYMYYEAVILACGGREVDIDTQLDEDWQDFLLTPIYAPELAE